MIQVLLSLVLVGDLNPNVGTTGFNFLKITPTAREAAMGSTAIGFGDNAFGIWYNPAGLAGTKQRQFGASYISHLAGINSGAASFVMPLAKMALGFGAYYLNGGEMARIDENQIEQGTFTPSCLDINVGGGMKIANSLMLGVTLKAVYSGIDSFWSLGLGANIGVSYDVPNTGLRASLVARNLGLTLKPFVTANEKLPTEFVAGLGYRAGKNLNLALEGLLPVDNNFAARVGAEWWLFKPVCLRAGITTAGADLKAGGGGDILAGLSTGLGVRVPIRKLPLEVDYAFTPMVVLGSAHRVSFRLTLQ
jgi:hypothetical protein